MGYCTQYNLCTSAGIPGVVVPEDIISQFRNQCEGAEYAIDDGGGCSESCKWYDHEKNLVDFSLKHKDVLFTLDGTGEDNDDSWILYVQSGKSQLCNGRIVYDEFDHAKLLADIRDSKIDNIID